jgi:hypothetical protein
LVKVRSQGNRILIARGEKFEELLFIQSGLELFGMNTAFGCFLLFERIESHLAKHGKVFRRLILADTVVIFIQSDIQNPMQFVLNRHQCLRTACKIRSAWLGKLEI